jgi:hypothetical protein
MTSQNNSPDIVEILDLDVIYLSYDEPQKEDFWVKIKNLVPWAKRVDGVKGSDSAHKAAAEKSSTERFILIDGDNIPDENFFELKLDFTGKNPDYKKAQYRWRAKNYINGLYYGNGGLSSWTKEHVLNMKTHENSEGDNRTNIEFCFHPLYWSMYNCYSTTYPNYSPKQAWRAGFREGVKMCSRDGMMPVNGSEFLKHVWPKNLQNLLIWQSIGRDVENGNWAILGARLGTHYLMLREWDYREVQDFECLDKLWELHKNDDEQVSQTIAQELNRTLGTEIVELDSAASKFFKHYISRGWRNKDIMAKEIDVIKQQEGW